MDKVVLEMGKKAITESKFILCVYSCFFLLLALWSSIPNIIGSDEGLVFGTMHPFGLSFSVAALLASIGTILRNRIVGYQLGLIIILISIFHVILRIFSVDSYQHKDLLLYFTCISLTCVLFIFGFTLKKMFPEYQETQANLETA